MSYEFKSIWNIWSICFNYLDKPIKIGGQIDKQMDYLYPLDMIAADDFVGWANYSEVGSHKTNNV